MTFIHHRDKKDYARWSNARLKDEAGEETMDLAHCCN